MTYTPLRIRGSISALTAAPLSLLGIHHPATFHTRFIRPISNGADLQKDLVLYLQQEGRKRQTITYRYSTERNNMAYLLPGLRRGLMLSTPLILSTPLLVQSFRRPFLCDSPDPLSKITSDIGNRYAHEAQTPIIKTSGTPNPRAIRQVSMGSILGVLAGLGVSVFSKPLAILMGLGIVFVQVSSFFQILKS